MYVEWNIFFKVLYYFYYCKNRYYVFRSIIEYYYYRGNGFWIDVFVLIFLLIDCRFEFFRLKFYMTNKLISGMVFLWLIFMLVFDVGRDGYWLW